MSEQLLAVLRLCLLGLIYLFFLRVLRAVWVEVHGPRRQRAAPIPTAAVIPPVPPAYTGSATAVGANATRVGAASTVAVASLRVVEPVGLAGRVFALSGEATIGRASGCLVLLDDTYVSQLHARISRSAEGYAVEDLSSTNGTYVNKTKVTGVVTLSVGDRLQVGNVVLVME